MFLLVSVILLTPQEDGYCCGRYASYWNAFLYLFWFQLADDALEDSAELQHKNSFNLNVTHKSKTQDVNNHFGGSLNLI